MLASLLLVLNLLLNPVSQSFADTFADPTVIRGQDGFWYAYATSDPAAEPRPGPTGMPRSRAALMKSATIRK